MEWPALFRFLAAFAVFYLVFPTLARGRAGLRSPVSWISAFVRFSLFLEASILLLGMVRLALPGTLAVLCALWAGLQVVQRNAPRIQSPDARRAWLSRFLDSWRRRGGGPIGSNLFAWKRGWKVALLPCVVLGMTFVARGLYPAQNWRLSDAESYDRALSLAVLSSGHDWRPDASIPLLLPLRYLASVTAPRTIAFSGPLFALLLVAAAPVAAYSLTRRRFPAIAAMSFASLVASFQPVGSPDGPASEMGAVYLLLAISLWRRDKADALMAITVGVAVSPSTELLHVFTAYAACVGIGVCTADLGWGRDVAAKLATGAALACFLVFGRDGAADRPDGRFQYEEAADFASRLTKALPRNSWAVVSRGQELPFVYGRGWHVNIGQFVAEADFAAARDPKYRIPVPVRDVYFFVETKPLQGYELRASAHDAIARRVPPILEPVGPEALARASDAFRLAEWLAAYRTGHDELATVYKGENVVVLRAPGSL